MKKETYLQMTGFFAARPRVARVLIGANKAITFAIYVAYPLLLIWLFIQGNPFSCWLAGMPLSEPAITWLQALLVPLVSFVLVSVVRSALNASRPYEVFSAQPIIPKQTKGKSFPSRHVFSIFVIGMTFLQVGPLIAGVPVLGIVVLALGVLLAIVRVLAGVHFPRDVVVGAVVGILAGLLV